MSAKRKTRKKFGDFSADRPIISVKSDRLGRKTFAEGLADRIQSWDGSDSLVIALCGEWGCGKTSLKNMVIEKLLRGASPKVDLLEFNPWEISGRDVLAVSFFRELALILAPGNDAVSPAFGTIRRLRLYAKLASFGGSALKVVGAAFATSGDGLGPAIGVAGETVSQTGNLANQGADAQEGIERAGEQSLADLKRSLTQDMIGLKRPILIVIDDIDRLSTNEIREVFQLVKANADFPNLIYLLMFDRGIVGGALDTISGGRGHEFLDKIVQVLFHVPQPSTKSIHHVLFDGLNKHLGDEGVSERWDKHRWSQIWSDGISTYFTNLRCVYRFLGSFGFHVSQMRSGKTFELNPLDLLVLETLRLFEPALYEALPSRKTALTGGGHWTSYANANESKEKTESEIMRLLAFTQEEKRARLREILAELFPALFGQTHVDEELLLRDLRVGHGAIFDRYFSMSLAADDVSQADLDILRVSITKSVDFAAACTSLIERGLLEIAFQRLDAYKQKFPKTVFPHLITTLINSADSFSEKTDGEILDYDAFVYAWRLIYFGVKEIEDEGERFANLRDGLAASVGVRMAVKIVAREERRKDSNDREFLVTEEHWAELKPLAIERIRIAASDGRLKAMTGLSNLLYRWREWTDEAEVRSWMTSNTKTSDDGLWLLRTFLSKMSSTSHKVVYIRYIRLDYLAWFADLPTIERLTSDIEISKLGKDDQRALRAFRQALIWKTEGKPDDYYGDTWRGDNPLAEES